jgi:hypothetical protein
VDGSLHTWLPLFRPCWMRAASLRGRRRRCGCWWLTRTSPSSATTLTALLKRQGGAVLIFRQCQRHAALPHHILLGVSGMVGRKVLFDMLMAIVTNLRDRVTAATSTLRFPQLHRVQRDSPHFFAARMAMADIFLRHRHDKVS